MRIYHGAMRTRNKYNTAHVSRRTADGITFASRAEMLRYAELKLMVVGRDLHQVVMQKLIELGPDFSTVVDFLVTDEDGLERVEEVKGHETPRFRQVRRLWPKYGPCPMWIMKRKRAGGWNVEIINGPPPGAGTL